MRESDWVLTHEGEHLGKDIWGQSAGRTQGSEAVFGYTTPGVWLCRGGPGGWGLGKGPTLTPRAGELLRP